MRQIGTLTRPPRVTSAPKSEFGTIHFLFSPSIDNLFFQLEQLHLPPEETAASVIAWEGSRWSP